MDDLRGDIEATQQLYTRLQELREIVNRLTANNAPRVFQAGWDDYTRARLQVVNAFIGLADAEMRSIVGAGDIRTAQADYLSAQTDIIALLRAVQEDAIGIAARITALEQAMHGGAR